MVVDKRVGNPIEQIPAVRPALSRINGLARRILIGHKVQAALVLSGLLLVFLWTPLTQGGYYAAADLMQPWPLTNTLPAGYHPKNGLIGDTVFEMIPSLYFNREQIRSGHLPLWNPYNGYGAPHLASYQTAVLSVFSLPFYIMSFRTALIAAVFLKLFALGFFTYLFLHAIGVRRFAAMVGGTAFMFSGYQLVWLNWAHVGGAVALPGGLYFAELAFQYARKEQAARRYLAFLGFAVILAIGLLAGHPETFFFGVLVVGPYLLFRLLQRQYTWRVRLSYAFGFGCAAALAITLAAPQLLAFFEYLPQSTLYALRGQHGSHGQLGIVFAPLTVFPDLLGNPSLRYEDPAIYGGGNYNELTDNYIGLIVFFLAGIAILTWFWHRSSIVAFFGAVVGTWFVYAYNAFGLGFLLQELPIVDQGVVNRSHDIWLFGLSCLAALGLHFVGELYIARDERQLRSRSYILIKPLLAAWSLVLLMLAYLGAFVLLGWATRQPNNMVGAGGARRFVFSHLLFIGATYILVAAGVLAFINSPRRFRTPAIFSAIALLAVVLTFGQSGWMHKDLNPTIADDLFYPVTPSLAAIRQYTGSALTLRADDSGIPANANLMYGLESVANYDGMGLKRHGDLLLRLLQVQAPHQVDWTAEQTARPLNLHALQVMGIQYVVTPLQRPFLYRSRPFVSPQPQQIQTWLLNDGMVSQSFTVNEPNLSQINVAISTYNRANTCSIRFALVDLTAAGTVAQSTVSCGDVNPDNTLSFRFAPQGDSKTHQYRIDVSSPDAGVNNSLGILYTAPPGSQLSSPSERLIVDPYSSAVEGVEQVWTDGRLRLFKVPGSLPTYYTVDTAVGTANTAAALDMIAAASFNEQGVVALVDPQVGIVPAQTRTSGGTPAPTVQVLERTPTRIHLRVERETSGWLVALQAYYPGWKAIVNGQDRKLFQANGTFSAVAVDSGTSDVVLEYDPLSIKIGFIASGAALLAVIVLMVLLARRARRIGDGSGVSELIEASPQRG